MIASQLPQALREEAEGALPKGTRVVKCNSEGGDATQDGGLGTVFSSLAVPEDLRSRADCEFFYFIIWDWLPNEPVGVLGWKVQAADG